MISIFCLLSFLGPIEDAPIRATIRMNRPEHHYYEIELVLPPADLNRRELKMAVWTPGSYKVRDFARNVEQFGAFREDGTPLDWAKTDKTTWVIAVPPNTAFKVIYRVFAYEFSVRTSYLDSFFGFINPASVFLYEPRIQKRPFEITVEPSNGWASVSSLQERSANRFTAANWDNLVDSPFQFGAFRRHDFDVRGIPHHWIIAGEVSMNEPVMVKSLQKIGETVGDIFGAYPFSKYTIFSQFRLDGAGGGLEHTNSTMVQAHSLKMRTKKGWDSFLSMMIHEYFHAWNVKAIHDKALGPFDYQKEVYTELLWLHEGWTSYYDLMLMRRAGFWSEKQYLERIAKEVDDYLTNPSITRQNLADASFNAWIHQYQPNRNKANDRISYYSAGAISALALDLLIRQKTKNTAGLDDVVRTLYRDYALQGRGVAWNDVAQTIAAIGGIGVRDFMQTYIRQANPMPMKTYLEYAGLKFTYTDPDEQDDDDAKPSAKEDKEKPYGPNPKVSLGVKTAEKEGAIFIDSVKKGGAGWRAGLDFDDEILAINDRRVSAENYDRVLAWSRPGDEVSVLVSRADKILRLPVKLEPAPQKLKLVLEEEPSALQQKIYDALFIRSERGKEGDHEQPN